MAQDRSPWFYIGVGCLVLVIVGGVAVVGGAFWIYRGAQRLKAELEDPVARTAKAATILGSETLPDGYHSLAAFSVPLVGDVVVLTDRPPGTDGQLTEMGERGLIYIKMFSIGQDEQELRDYFSGKTSDPGVLRRNKIDIDADEIIGRGVLSSGEASLLYVSQRGSVSTQGFEGAGITSVILVDCPDDKKMRTAIWFGPDPDPSAGVERIDLAGTPADEAAITSFMGRFRFCG